MHRREGGGVLMLAMHPQVIGVATGWRCSKRFVAHCRDVEATFARTADVARAFGRGMRSRSSMTTSTSRTSSQTGRGSATTS